MREFIAQISRARKVTELEIPRIGFLFLIIRELRHVSHAS